METLRRELVSEHKDTLIFIDLSKMNRNLSNMVLFSSTWAVIKISMRLISHLILSFFLKSTLEMYKAYEFFKVWISGVFTSCWRKLLACYRFSVIRKCFSKTSSYNKGYEILLFSNLIRWAFIYLLHYLFKDIHWACVVCEACATWENHGCNTDQRTRGSGAQNPVQET